MKRLLTALLLLIFAGCSSAPTPTPEMKAPDLSQIRSLVERGQDNAALQELEPFRWSESGSIEAERLRQDLRLRTGGLVSILEELALWQGQWKKNPDLQYLATRIVEDPVVRRDQFHGLLRLYPAHPWIRFGAIATAQQMGDWHQAQRWLEIPLPQALPTPYQNILQARQLAQQGDADAALLLLEADAFPNGLQISLSEYLGMASSAGDSLRQARALSEMALRQAKQGNLATEQAIDLAFLRLQGEWPWIGKQKFSTILKQFDVWLTQVGAPSGWAEHPAYSVAGVAKLLQPESNSGELAQQFSSAGRVLLAGSAWGRGNEMHLLQDTQSLPLKWPGHAREVELIFAQGVTSTAKSTAQGGTVFRGFYVLLDSMSLGAVRLGSRLERFKPPTNLAPSQGRLESLELAQRLRLQFLKETDFEIEEIELLHLCLHESGHFTEILSWLDFGLPVTELLPAMLASRQRYGDPLLWLEYRAQLRALSSGRIPHWIFAEILERGQEPRDPYFLPYRHILLDLVNLAEDQQWPPLSQWHRKSPEDFTRLAIALCAQKGITPMPLEGVENLVQVLIEADLLQQTPPHRAVAD
ncbi:MAG: hypothetical protein O3A95_01235 [Planctomycetota bacterium]|nr:hypothetical protein [Planctomycetota bacterium]MDA1112909.1 hypothetical protein [Planctomycetota bacterium]